ncbi:MAG: hypothetical protein OER96_02475 [Gammaproteobacteria bacterium]|nr:hypothetical protein [Gammaproteobacteria bacterium]
MSECRKKVTVELANKETGEREEIVTLDNRVVVSRVVSLFAQRQHISTDQVDVHVTPAVHHVAL